MKVRKNILKENGASVVQYMVLKVLSLSKAMYALVVSLT